MKGLLYDPVEIITISADNTKIINTLIRELPTLVYGDASMESLFPVQAQITNYCNTVQTTTVYSFPQLRPIRQINSDYRWVSPLDFPITMGIGDTIRLHP